MAKDSGNAVNQKRRSILKLGKWFGQSIVGYPFFRMAEKAADKAVEETYRRVKVVDQFLDWVSGERCGKLQQSVIDRASLVYELFLSSETETEFIPPTNWGKGLPDVPLPGGVKTYGHEAAVLKSIANFVGLSVPLETWDIKKNSWLAHQNCSQVMLASGSSNLATRTVIGTPERPMFGCSVGGRAVRLTYSIGMGSGVITRHQYHEQVTRNKLAICKADGSRVLQAEKGPDGFQADDYLLVTRVPGPAPHSVYTVLSGLHGPGTRSAELLFSALSSKNLNELASCIGHERGHVPYFQAVFRASKLNFSRVEGSQVPVHIELVTSEKCPPVPIAIVEP
jgi:hypothetical protein